MKTSPLVVLKIGFIPSRHSCSKWANSYRDDQSSMVNGGIRSGTLVGPGIWRRCGQVCRMMGGSLEKCVSKEVSVSVKTVILSIVLVLVIDFLRCVFSGSCGVSRESGRIPIIVLVVVVVLVLDLFRRSTIKARQRPRYRYRPRLTKEIAPVL
jgi:hypothetical protein